MVTERGTPIAELVPITRPAKGTVLDQFIADGLASPATGSITDYLARVGGPIPGPSASERLEELRADER